MQKRTNPLELKVDSKDYTPAPTLAEQEAAAPAPVEEPITAPEVPTATEVAQEPKAAEAAPRVEAEAPVQEAPAAEPLPADRVAPVRPGRPAPVRPVLHNSAEDKVRHGEHVADNDVSVAVKFRVSGDRVDRRLVVTRVSKDLCKLAQSLYPGQSLGSIIEGALLTRAFLQDRDAFDKVAREIIQKGGKIKC